jgi:hypothetical protein
MSFEAECVNSMIKGNILLKCEMDKYRIRYVVFFYDFFCFFFQIYKYKKTYDDNKNVLRWKNPEKFVSDVDFENCLSFLLLFFMIFE